jgi:hypothetical protein
MEAIYSSETSIATEQTTRRHIPDYTLQAGFSLRLFFSTLKMEATCSSETSIATEQTTRRHIPDDTLQAGFSLRLFFSTLKMEAICSSETSDDTQRTTHGTLHNHGCENLNSYMELQVCHKFDTFLANGSFEEVVNIHTITLRHMPEHSNPMGIPMQIRKPVY